MWTCPKCGDGIPPLKIHFHKIQCNGLSKLIKGIKPGHVSAKSVRTPGAVLRREKAIEVYFAKGGRGRSQRSEETTQRL